MNLFQMGKTQSLASYTRLCMNEYAIRGAGVGGGGVVMQIDLFRRLFRETVFVWTNELD